MDLIERNTSSFYKLDGSHIELGKTPLRSREFKPIADDLLRITPKKRFHRLLSLSQGTNAFHGMQTRSSHILFYTCLARYCCRGSHPRTSRDCWPLRSGGACCRRNRRRKSSPSSRCLWSLLQWSPAHRRGSSACDHQACVRCSRAHNCSGDQII